MESQERIRIIDLAWEWVKTYALSNLPDSPEPRIAELAKRFDKAYKAIIKAVTGGDEK